MTPPLYDKVNGKKLNNYVIIIQLLWIGSRPYGSIADQFRRLRPQLLTILLISWITLDVLYLARIHCQLFVEHSRLYCTE